MCGICGVFAFNQSDKGVLSRHSLQLLISKLVRRGPDDEGYWSDDQHCALGFRRLSIIDLTPAAHQPIITVEQRYALVMNGEIYNFLDLRRELEAKGCRFRSSGDAEVALYAFAEWGTAALNRFNGMFSLAFYDRLENRLVLARDHAGIKPLYYHLSMQGIVFGSQYDVIMSHPWVEQSDYDPGSVALYMRFGYIPAPYAVLSNTHALEAGSWIAFEPSGNTGSGRYFSFPQYQHADLASHEALEAVNSAVSHAVRRQMISDVPLGVFLSGGIDSPLVAAITQSFSREPIKAFTIGVEDDRIDESTDAVTYARKIGVDHRLQIIRYDQVASLVSDVVSACSEPFGDYSIFPTMLVSRLASQHVKVMISGDGGDELFWGYSGRMATAIKNAGLFHLPHPIRFLLSLPIRHPFAWNLRHFRKIGEWYRSSHEHNYESYLMHQFPGISGFPQDYGQYDFSGGNRERTAQWVRWNEFTGHMGKSLLKVDRGSMYHSLEVRVPLLDREVVETALRVKWNTCMDLKSRTGKLPLRAALNNRLSYQTQQKRGFEVPMGDWLRGALRPMFEDLVCSGDEILGLSIDNRVVREVYTKHLEKKEDRTWGLWILLSAALWQKKYRQKHASNS